MRLTSTAGAAGRRFGADRRGVAAVEFALIVPILLMLYFGVVELTQAEMTELRVAHTASAIGDLATQSASVTSAGVDQIFDLGDALMYPYPTTPLAMRLTSLSEDAKGNLGIDWSRGQGMPKMTAAPTLPKNVVSAGESVIVAESQYTYTSVFGVIMPKPIVFKETYYLRPRVSSAVTCGDC